MVARNDITGDAIQTRVASKAFSDNYDTIFRKGNTMSQEQKQGTCGCGRSPTGDCCGWHGLNEDELAQRKELYETGKVDLYGKEIK